MSLNEVFSVVRSEENRRITMLGETSSKGSTMLTNEGEGLKFKSQQRMTDGLSKSQGKEACQISDLIGRLFHTWGRIESRRKRQI